jgi:hypothetical protein
VPCFINFKIPVANLSLTHSRFLGNIFYIKFLLLLHPYRPDKKRIKNIQSQIQTNKNNKISGNSILQLISLSSYENYGCLCCRLLHLCTNILKKRHDGPCKTQMPANKEMFWRNDGKGKFSLCIKTSLGVRRMDWNKSSRILHKLDEIGCKSHSSPRAWRNQRLTSELDCCVLGIVWM